MEEGPKAVELHSLTAVLCHSSLCWRVGYYNETSETTEFCCTKKLVDAHVCSLPNVAIVNKTTDNKAFWFVALPSNGRSNAISEVCARVVRCAFEAKKKNKFNAKRCHLHTALAQQRALARAPVTDLHVDEIGRLLLLHIRLQSGRHGSRFARHRRWLDHVAKSNGLSVGRPLSEFAVLWRFGTRLPCNGHW